MVTRRHRHRATNVAEPVRRPLPKIDGDLSTYERFRDRLLLAAAALVVALIVAWAADQMRRITNLENDIRQMRETTNTRFATQAAGLSSDRERVTGLERELEAGRSDVLRRLQRIEDKLDEQAKAR